MGIRGIDVQVAIQRAAEAQKIQQGETSQSRAGEAGHREEAEFEKARKREASQKSERGDQVVIRRDKGRRQGRDASSGQPETDEKAEEVADEEGIDELEKERRRRIARGRGEGKLDILA